MRPAMNETTAPPSRARTNCARTARAAVAGHAGPVTHDDDNNYDGSCRRRAPVLWRVLVRRHGANGIYGRVREKDSDTEINRKNETARERARQTGGAAHEVGFVSCPINATICFLFSKPRAYVVNALSTDVICFCFLFYYY